MEHIEAYDLIYNRFDLIYPDNYFEGEITNDNCNCKYQAHEINQVAELNLWGKDISETCLQSIVGKVFNDNENIIGIKATGYFNNYGKMLIKGRETIISLPDSIEELDKRIRRKHRSYLKSQEKHLALKYGEVKITVYSDHQMLKIVNIYFKWKRQSHGTEYNLSPEEYLQQYHVTDAMALNLAGEPIAVLFYCLVDKTVYLENLSYDMSFGKYSPGIILYKAFLERMIFEGCRNVFLGKSGLDYKKRFGSTEFTSYNGIIYRKEIFNEINAYFRRLNITNVAIYGLGKLGHQVLQYKNELAVVFDYGIDRNGVKIDGFTIYKSVSNAPQCQIAIITIEKKNPEIEDNLKAEGFDYIYWVDLITESINQYNSKSGVAKF